MAAAAAAVADAWAASCMTAKDRLRGMAVSFSSIVGRRNESRQKCKSDGSRTANIDPARLEHEKWPHQG